MEPVSSPQCARRAPKSSAHSRPASPAPGPARRIQITHLAAEHLLRASASGAAVPDNCCCRECGIAKLDLDPLKF